MEISGQRILENKWSANFVRYFSVLAILYHLYAAQFGAPEVLKYRSTHIAIFLSLAFLLYGFTKNSSSKIIPWYDYLLVILAILPTAYIFINYKYFTTRYLYISPLRTTDYVFGIIAIILIIEACRRCLGYPLPILFVIVVSQSLFGNIFPGPLRQTPISFKLLIDHLFMSTSGLFGLITGMSATFIIMFVIFGSMFEESKGGQLFMDVASAVLGKARGGPAKTAIIASSLFGSISGSAVANVYATGCVTIPLMKKSGFKPSFAAAVEAVASTSGQLVPPVMGTAAFLMANFLGIPYIKVVQAAILPAFLYLFSLYINVHIESERLKLPAMGKSLVKKARKNILKNIHLFFPIFIIVYLLIQRRTPFFSAYWGIITAFIVAQLSRHTRISFKGLLDSFERAARRLVPIAVALFTANLIVGVIELTGLGLRITSALIHFSGGNLAVTLFLTMVVSLILGMGLPTTAAYLIVAIFAAPALIQMGIDPLASHLFVFYYAILSEITPPVALSAYAAATVAEAPMQKTAFKAMQLGAVVFVMPWLIIYNTNLIYFRGNPWVAAEGILTIILGIIPFVSGVQGYLFNKSNIIERVIGFASGFFLFMPGVYSDILGLILFLLLSIYQLFGKKKYFHNNRISNEKT